MLGIGNWMVVYSNLGLSKIVFYFFLQKIDYGMNVKSLKTLVNWEADRRAGNYDLMVNQEL